MTLQKKNKFLLHASLCILLSCSTTLHPQLSDQATLSTYQGSQGPWKYLEYIFVIKPQNELKHQSSHLFSLAGLGGAAFLTYSLFSTDKTQTIKNSSQTPDTPQAKPTALYNMTMIASAIALSKTAYGYFTCYTQRNIYKNTLTNFLKNWNTHRPHVPTAVVECFDELALAYQSQGDTALTSSLVTEVFELIQHHIEHHFENRYKQAEKKNIDPVETFKNVTETWKNLG